ncbi:MAG: PadR family transcriptional regulator, partial [Bifidobacteriaceae bacterium]|nr:PadR family transcriptional regulator [Bifidobacteriaceae bacterium]
MTVSMALLALLDPGPAHGFELKRRYDALLGRERELKFGQVYATLQRLERDGLAADAGVEPGSGSDRKLYAITPAGAAALDQWLALAEPEPTRPGGVFARVVLALASGRPAAQMLDAHRRAYLDRVRELARAPGSGEPLERLAADYETAHLEADLRWIALAADRLASGDALAAATGQAAGDPTEVADRADAAGPAE